MLLWRQLINIPFSNARNIYCKSVGLFTNMATFSLIEALSNTLGINPVLNKYENKE
jgi:hypothetical protein